LTDRGEEKIEGILRHFLTRRKHKTSRTNCPDEEVLASYLGRLLEDDEAMRLEAHLAECSLCVEDIVAFYKSTQGREGDKVPQRVIDRALSLVPDTPPQENVLDLVIRLVKHSLELVSTSGQLVFISPPLSVRAIPKTPQATVLQVEKEMAEFKVTIEVEHVEAGLCQVVVRTEAEGNRPADDIRLSLFSGDREQASYLARRGQAVFDRLPVGAYNVAITDAGTPVGTIRLGLTD
jgi:hypothetical protein